MVCGEGLVSLLACSGTIAYSCAVGSMGMMGKELLLLSRRHCWGSVSQGVQAVGLPVSLLLAGGPRGRLMGLWPACHWCRPLLSARGSARPFSSSSSFWGEEGGGYLSFETYASMTAMATMFTMSLTLESKSVKWIGLFSPICIGPMTSVSGEKALMSL